MPTKRVNAMLQALFSRFPLPYVHHFFPLIGLSHLPSYEELRVITRKDASHPSPLTFRFSSANSCARAVRLKGLFCWLSTHTWPCDWQNSPAQPLQYGGLTPLPLSISRSTQL